MELINSLLALGLLLGHQKKESATRDLRFLADVQINILGRINFIF